MTVGLGVVAHRVEGAQLQGPLGPVGSASAGHVPADGPQAHADRATDQAGAHHHGPPGSGGVRGPRQPRAIRPGGRRAGPRALEVHVVQLVAGLRSVLRWIITRMHIGVPPSMSSSRAQISGHVAQPELAGRQGREGPVDVVGGGEQHADQVVVVEAVALEQRLEQGDHPLEQVLGLVDVDGGGAAQGADGGGHGAARLRRRSGPGPSGPAGRRPLQAPHLGLGQRPPLPRGEAAVGQRPDPDPHQPPHRVADRLAHAPDLAVAALVDGDAQRVAVHQGHLGRGGGAVLQLDALPQPPQRPRDGVPSTSARYSLSTPKDGWVRRWASSPSLVSSSRPSVSASRRPTG